MDSVANIGAKWIVETYGNEFVMATTKCKCKCGSIFINTPKERCRHFSTKKHNKYAFENRERIYREEHPEIQEIALPLPTTTDEIQEIPINDKDNEPTPEIIPPSTDTPLTKAEIRKQKKADYMREYMRGYHAKRYNEDPEYRQYRKDMVSKSSCNMGARYVKAYQYIKEHGINLFDEKGN
jgi:hypothetical protein